MDGDQSLGCGHLQSDLGMPGRIFSARTFPLGRAAAPELCGTLAMHRHDRWCLWRRLRDRRVGYVRDWPIVLVGFLGKVFGPVGFLQAEPRGSLPWNAGWIIVTLIVRTQLVATTFDGRAV